ncbi:MAG: hypothetical protein ACJ8M4_12290 [Chthoniobacterales bacterium]
MSRFAPALGLRCAILRAGIGAGMLLLSATAGKAGFQDAYIQVSVFHKPGYQNFETNGYGRFGSGYTGVPFDFSWGDIITQPGGPEVTSGWAGFGTLLSHDVAGYSIKGGTGVWQSGGNGFAAANVHYNTSGVFYWYPDHPGDVANGIVWIRYILQGHVGPAATDYVEFTADVQFNTASAGMIPLHLHYKNSQPGATFSGVVLYAEAPFSIHTVNGNFRAEFDIVESTNFTVVDPGEASLSGVGNLGPVTGSGPSPTPVPVVQPARAQNIATRETVLNGDNALIGGFIVTGTDPKKVLIRGIGPSTGLNGVLSDPTLELRNASNQLVASNDNWKINDQSGASQEAEVQATTIPPQNDHESAIIATLPGANSAYTAILRGKGGATGVGLVEVYDLSDAAGSQLANISTRGFVGVGQDVLIGGIIIGPNSSPATRLVVRAIGPSLTQLGISNALSDPTLELHDSNGAVIKRNDNWKIDDQSGQSQEAEISATSLQPSADLESALTATVSPGNYTAIVAGKNDGSGVGLVEVYNLQ